MKRKASIGLAALLAAMLVLTACGGSKAVETSEETTERVPSYELTGAWDEDFTRTNDNLNGLCDYTEDETLVNYEKTEATQKGTVVPVEYDTYFYALDAQNGDVNSHATPVTKTCYVYLPANYDETKQYNILYLYHGGGDNECAWFKNINRTNNDDSEVGTGYAVNILDHMIEDGLMDACIVVTPTFYCNEIDPDGTMIEDSTSLVDYAAYELRDLIPVIESTYSTYTTDTTTAEGLSASRDHRAMAGLSMGSMTTWRSGICQCLDLFSWFGCMSAAPEAADTEDVIADWAANKIIPALEAGDAAGYKINMFLNFNGAIDMTLQPHIWMHQQLLNYMETSDILRVGENYDFISSESGHQFSAWNLYLYDMMQVFFK